jgi:hypothetical protein
VVLAHNALELLAVRPEQNNGEPLTTPEMSSA